MLFRFTQWAKLILYNHKELIVRLFSILNVGVVVTAFFFLIYDFGFPDITLSVFIEEKIIQWFLIFFILQFLLRWLFAASSEDYIKKNRIEAGLLLFLIPELLALIFFNSSLLSIFLKKSNIIESEDIHLGIFKCYLFVLSSFEFLKTMDVFGFLNIKASSSLILSLLTLSFIGGAVLTMPECTTIPGSMSFFEALFTSVSAISQTGLILQDTGTFFTLKGQVVIMLLIQVGALGVISFGTFFGSYVSKGVNIKQKYSFQDFFFSDAEVDTTRLFKNIMYYTIAIDLIGAFIIYPSWGDTLQFTSVGDRFFWSLFHSVSAFCNAGFSLMGNSLYTDAVKDVYGLHVIVMVLVFLGSIGYPTLFEIFSFKKYREMNRIPWKRWKLDTRLSMYTTLFLVFGGGLIYYLLEKNNTLAGMDETAAGVTAIFQSTMRTAGFNTVDISQVGVPMLLIFCFLMFVGGSSASVCGGIKTSTFAITVVSIYNAFKGKRRVEIAGKEISYSILAKALAIWFFAILFIFICCFALLLTDGDIPIMQLVFEQISAVGTVGLSTGITAQLSMPGKYIILISMFVGRVGSTTVAFALISQAVITHYKYPDANIALG